MQESTWFKLPRGEKRGLVLQFLAGLPEDSTRTPMHELVSKLLQNFQGVFTEPQGLPPRRSHDHGIPLKEGAQPVCVRPYRYACFQKDEFEKIVKELLQNRVIRPSQSPFSLPVLLVRKADGTWHMCVDYRALNSVTVKDKFPIPVIDELLDELHRAT